MTALNSVGNLRVDAAVAAATAATPTPTPVGSANTANPLTAAAAQVTPTGTAGATTAAQGASTAASSASTGNAQGAASEQKAEAYNAPALDLPDEPTTQDVLVSITRAMASPGVNQTTINTLKELQSSLFDAQKQMITEVLNGVVS